MSELRNELEEDNNELKSERKEMSAIPSLPEIEIEEEESNEENAKLEKIYSFKKIVNEFLTDLLKTFPELIEDLDLNLLKIWKQEGYTEEDQNSSVETVIEYCEKIYPERFFDLLYQHDGGLFSYMLFVGVYFNCLSILVMWQYYYNLLQIKMILSYSFIEFKQTYMISERNVETQLHIPYSYRELY